VGIKDKQ